MTLKPDLCTLKYIKLITIYRRIEMGRIVLALAIVFSLSTAGMGQAYYEASGKTQVFTLAAGIKAGPSGIKDAHTINHSVMNTSISVITTKSAISISLLAIQSGYASITLYNIAGRQICSQRGYSGTVSRLKTQSIAPGIYNMIIRVNGRSFVHRIAVNGFGE
jgi:hypothetical protein